VITDTIAAVATAPGRGGVGIVRVSAKDAHGLANICARVLGKTLIELLPRQAQYLDFIDADGSVLDSGLALYFPAPHSYTGEHVLELQGHGGPVILQLLLRSVFACGTESAPIRLADPGEFTRRAFLNDKLDLAQAEAVADLIDASTEQAARSATRSLQGEFSATISRLVEQLTQLRMLVEATLDFPEEELEFLKAAGAKPKLLAIQSQIQSVFSKATQGALLREGLRVVLMGKPNVGKSSLLNALAGEEVAIVTPIAGTTRDRVVQGIQIEGIPIHIVDTAGLRQTDDEIEKIGITRTIQALDDADVIVWLRDALTDQSLDSFAQLQVEFGLKESLSKSVLQVFNKVDLVSSALTKTNHDGEVLFISAKNGLGLDQLKQTLLKRAGWQQEDGLFLARERHLAAMTQAQGHVAESLKLMDLDKGDQFLELIAEELRLAQMALSAITGSFTADDLLGVIFSRFCIGK
jgi:tRNA modification GTPase